MLILNRTYPFSVMLSRPKIIFLSRFPYLSANIHVVIDDKNYKNHNFALVKT